MMVGNTLNILPPWRSNYFISVHGRVVQLCRDTCSDPFVEEEWRVGPRKHVWCWMFHCNGVGTREVSDR